MAVAFAAALALRLFHLGRQSLWVDEIITWHTSAAHSFDLRDVLQNDHGPLVQVLLHGWTRLAGDSEFALRLPSAVASALLVPVFAALGRRLLGPRAWLPAAWIAALSPFLVWYGQEARNYAFATLFSTLAAWAAVRWHERGKTADGVVLALAAWLGILSNLNVLLVLPVLLVYVALPHGGRPGRPWAALAALAAIVALDSPWIVEYARRLAWERLVPGREALPAETPLRGETTFSWGAYPFTLYSFSVGYTLGPSLQSLHLVAPWRAALAHWPIVAATGAVFGGLALRGVALLGRHRARLAFLLGLVVVPLLGVTYFALQNFKVFNPRYVSAGLAGYYLLLLAGWLSLARRWRFVAAVLVLGLWGLSLGNHYFDPNYGKEDYRRAVAWVAERIGPGDRLVAAGSAGVLEYYWRGRRPPFDHYWLGFAENPLRMRERFAGLVDSAATAFVIVTRPYALDPRGRFEAYLQAERGATPVRFFGVTVYRVAGHVPAGPGGPTAERGRKH